MYKQMVYVILVGVWNTHDEQPEGLLYSSQCPSSTNLC